MFGRTNDLVIHNHAHFFSYSMRQRGNFRLFLKPHSNSLYDRPKHTTMLREETIPRNLHMDNNCTLWNKAYTKLLNLCMKQCKQIQSRRMFDEMPERLLHASNVSRLVHSQSLKFGFGLEGKLGNAIVELYAKCGNVECAEKAFSQFDNRDIVAWNTVLSMYSRRGFLEQVIQHFGSMRNCRVSPNEYTFAVLLSSCTRLMAAEYGKQVHCNVIKMGFEFNSFCEGSLIDMYAKLNSLVNARRIFDCSKDPDTISWTALIAGYVQIGLPGKAVKLFEDMQNLGRHPDQVALITIITAYMGLGRLDDACYLFSQIPNPNSVAWNMMISGHAKRGYEWEAVQFFHDMRKHDVKSTRSTLGSVLSAIANLTNLDYGLQVHSQAVKQGLDSNVYVGSSLITMYSKCQKMENAKEVFKVVNDKNVVLWNAMLGGYAQNGYTLEVLELFLCMEVSGCTPDEFTYTSILSACGGLRNLQMGHQLHSRIIKNKLEANLFVGNALVDMYAKSGDLIEARKLFDRLRVRDNVSWNAIIVGYVQEGNVDEAFKLFCRMKSDGFAPDEVSLATILSACANLCLLHQGEQVHCLSVKHGLETSLYSGSSLLDMYAKCGAIGAAYEVFICMPEISVVSTNALIAGYAQRNLQSAVNLFQYMLAEGLKPSAVTYVCLLDACSGPSTLKLGKQIHCFVLKEGFLFDGDFLGVSLLCMYMNSKGTREAHILFSELPCPKSAILWTAIIAGHAQNGCSDEALQLYREMRRNCVMPDQATFASVLQACAISTNLRDGREIHSLVFRSGFVSDELTCSALIDMYAKCGNVSCSFQVFTETESKNDVISWNSMIVGFAKNGYVQDALHTFNEMKQTAVKPDHVTFLGVLTACSHAGRVSEGRQIFNDMVDQYHIQPRVDHYACMIDLLGRWGFLDEARDFIDKLEVEPHAMMWASFLGACRIHGDDIRGQYAAEKLIELEPQNSSPYVLLSNIYAASQNWDGVNSVRRMMKEKGVTKSPGCSWIVVEQNTNLFVAGDKLHHSSDEIQATLKDLAKLMKDEDYAEIECFIHIDN